MQPDVNEAECEMQLDANKVQSEVQPDLNEVDCEVQIIEINQYKSSDDESKDANCILACIIQSSY